MNSSAAAHVLLILLFLFLTGVIYLICSNGASLLVNLSVPPPPPSLVRSVIRLAALRTPAAGEESPQSSVSWTLERRVDSGLLLSPWCGTVVACTWSSSEIT